MQEGHLYHPQRPTPIQNSVSVKRRKLHTAGSEAEPQLYNDFGHCINNFMQSLALFQLPCSPLPLIFQPCHLLFTSLLSLPLPFPPAQSTPLRLIDLKPAMESALPCKLPQRGPRRSPGRSRFLLQCRPTRKKYLVAALISVFAP